MKYKVVEITVGKNRIKAHPATVRISKSKKQEVSWVGDLEFAVEFKEGASPFGKSVFQSCERAAVSGTAQAKGDFPYTVSSPHSKHKLDPGVHVDK